AAVPFHVLGRFHGHAAFDEVEIENQIEGGNHDDHEREADADQSRLVDIWNVNPEKADHELDKVEKEDRTRCRDNAEAKLLCHLDDARAIEQEHHCQHTEGQAHRL